MRIWIHSIFCLAILLGLTSCLREFKPCEPYAVRLNLGLYFYDSSEPEMLGIRFNTRSQCPSSYVIFQASSSLFLRVPCQTDSFILGNYTGYIHKCSVTKLGYGDSFSYMAYGWSGATGQLPIPFEKSMIKSHLLNKRKQVRLVALADWGYLIAKAGLYDPLDNAIKSLIQYGDYIDALYIGGDIAYDVDFYQGQYYEDFIIMLSQAASRWPVILNLGNHQHLTVNDQIIVGKSFQTYGALQNRLTVLNLTYVNLFMLDPYRIFAKLQTPDQLVQKFDAKLQELKNSSPQKPIITCSHYPYRCNGNIPDCTDVRAKLLPLFNKMIEYNVALYMGAHYHTYERVYPYFSNDTFKKVESPYVWKQGGAPNPVDNTLLSIVEGIAGNDRQIIVQYPPPQPYTAASVIGNTGFGIMTIQEGSLSYMHVLHDNPFDAKDQWQILFQKKDRKNEKQRNIRSEQQIQIE